MKLSWCPQVMVLSAVLSGILVIQGCSDKKVRDSAPAPDSVDISSIPDAVPRSEPKSRYGNPSSYEVFGNRYYVMDDATGFTQKGIASWYGKKFHGRRTSSGETYDMYAMTAAHKSLPLPTYVEVRNLENDRRIIVKVNDRGPFHDNRIIDLSYTAARKLDVVKMGTALVEIRAIDARNWAQQKRKKEQGSPVRTVSSGPQQKGFYIQVGAFSEEQNALRLKQNMLSLGRDMVRIYQANVNSRKVYRVQVGPLYDVDSADKIVAQLGDFGIREHRIVVP